MKKIKLVKKWMTISVILTIALVASVFGASVVSEFPICTQGSFQYEPAISGDVVVSLFNQDVANLNFFHRIPS